MNKVLLTYDVHDSKVNHAQLRKDLLSDGWKDSDVSDDGLVCYLPNTTFWKANTDATTERNAFLARVGIDAVIRLFVHNIDGWAALRGIPHADNK